MTPYKETYKYPFIVTEILSCKNKLIEESLLNTKDENEEENNILNLFKVLDNEKVLNTTLPGYINRIIASHIENALLYDNIIKYKNIIFDILLKYVYNDYFRDIFYLIVNEVVKKGNNEYYEIIHKLFELIINNMNKYIKNDNNNDIKDNLFKIKNSLMNLLNIIVKLIQNNQSNDDLLKFMVKKLSDENLVNNLLNKLIINDVIDYNKSNEENENINKCNINIFYCINKIIFLFNNILNNILSKIDNDIYSFYKYYLTTIIEPPYYSAGINNLSMNENENEVDDDNINDNENDDDNNNNIDNESTEKNNKEKDKKLYDEETYKILFNLCITNAKELYTSFRNQIKNIPNISKSTILSINNSISDLLILLIVIEKKDKEKMNELLNEILLDLVILIVDFPSCSLIHNKTLKIFKLISEYNISIKKDEIVSYLKKYFNDKQILNELITDEKIILNNKKESINNVYLINILNLLEKQEEKNIVDYLAKINEGLFENDKLKPGEYTPKPDEEEIIFQKKQDIHDSEGFIFTPKKVIEDSKKIMKNLKDFDV